MKLSKKEVTAFLIAATLVITGVILSSKEYSREFSGTKFKDVGDRKDRHQFARYMINNNILLDKKLCENFANKASLDTDKKACIKYILGEPDIVQDNKFTYIVFSDEIILWRKYLVIQFSKNKNEISSVELNHFL